MDAHARDNDLPVPVGLSSMMIGARRGMGLLMPPLFTPTHRFSLFPSPGLSVSKMAAINSLCTLYGESKGNWTVAAIGKSTLAGSSPMASRSKKTEDRGELTMNAERMNKKK